MGIGALIANLTLVAGMTIIDLRNQKLDHHKQVYDRYYRSHQLLRLMVCFPAATARQKHNHRSHQDQQSQITIITKNNLIPKHNSNFQKEPGKLKTQMNKEHWDEVSYSKGMDI